MRLFYEINPGQSLVVVTYEAHPSYREWVDLMHEIFVDSQFKPGFDFIFDKRSAGEAASNDYAEAVAAFNRKHADKIGRCAIVVHGALAYGMSRMTEAYSPKDRVRVFTELGQARVWLHATPRVNRVADAA